MNPYFHDWLMKQWDWDSRWVPVQANSKSNCGVVMNHIKCFCLGASVEVLGYEALLKTGL